MITRATRVPRVQPLPYFRQWVARVFAWARVRVGRMTREVGRLIFATFITCALLTASAFKVVSSDCVMSAIGVIVGHYYGSSDRRDREKP